MNDPSVLFSKTMYRALSAFIPIQLARQTAHTALDSSMDCLLKIERMRADQIFNTNQSDKFFNDKEGFLRQIGGVENFAKANAEKRAKEFISFSEASSLVFAHSILDAVSHDLCLVILDTDPSAWRNHILNKTIKLAAALSKQSGQLEYEIASSYVANLERDSLLQKIDSLFAVCKPPKNFRPSEEFMFDRSKLVELDEKRHTIVHENFTFDIKISVDDIFYLQQTAIFLCAMVSTRFNVKADIKKIISNPNL